MKMLLKVSSFLFALAAIIITARPGSCDQVTTVNEEGSAVSLVTTTDSTPCIIMTNSAVQPVIVVSKLSLNPTPIVMRPGTITGFTVFKPDDLITRRDDLLARIAVEHARGKLSLDESNALIGRVQSIDADRAKLQAPLTTGYFHQVKRMYRSYDRLSNDIKSDTKEGDKQLAGRYNYLIL
jgi:hypothetical protein